MLKRDGVLRSQGLEWLRTFPAWHKAKVSRGKAVGAKAKAAQAEAKRRTEAEKRRAREEWGNDGRPVFVPLDEAEREQATTGRTPKRGEVT